MPFRHHPLRKRDGEQFANFDPLAVSGFVAEQLANFDPFAMGGFDAEQFANFDPFAMGGFDALQVENFDPLAVAGFVRDHVTRMEIEALAGFGLEQVLNLDEDAKLGIGDKVRVFDDFDLDVRKEFVDDEARRLGGVGSFEELASKLADIAGSATIAEELKDLGWDTALDRIANIEFGAPDDSVVPEGISDEALAKALAAFG